MKTRERRGSSFSQLGLEPNHTGLTAQSLFFLEESCRVKRSDTQTFSNYSKRVKAFQNVLQLLQIKRLQLKLTNHLQNSYQIITKHQVPKTWVKQQSKNTKNPQKRKIHLQALPCTNWSHLVPKLVPTWFLRFDGSDSCSYKLKTATYLFSCTCSVPR